MIKVKIPNLCVPVYGKRIFYLNQVSDVYLHRKLYALANKFLAVDNQLIFCFRIEFLNLNGSGSGKVVVFKVYKDKEYVLKTYNIEDSDSFNSYYKEILKSCNKDTSIEVEEVYDLEDGGQDDVLYLSDVNIGGLDSSNPDADLQN